MNSAADKKRIWILLILLFFLLHSVIALSQDTKKIKTFPTTDAIEKELWNLINEERRLYDLPLLELSSALSDLARQHSLDMANRGEPSHSSSNGKTLVNRLEEADIYYVDAGENVAFSETYVAEFIHESLFNSGEHRESILDPDFTQIGIGVFHQENNGYYVTQDFLSPLKIKTDNQVTQIVLDQINTDRHLMALPPLASWEEAEQFSQKLAEKRATGQALPVIPSELRETLIIFLSTPSLTQEELNFPEAVNPRYNRGTLGIWFGKNRDYPGGVYVLSLMLFAENVSHTLSPEEQKQYIFELINKKRAQQDLKMFAFDEQLTEAAERTASKAALRRRSDMPILPEYAHLESLTYGTEDITLLPDALDSTVRKTHLTKIGIGVIFRKNPGSQKGTFYISLIFE